MLCLALKQGWLSSTRLSSTEYEYANLYESDYLFLLIIFRSMARSLAYYPQQQQQQQQLSPEYIVKCEERSILRHGGLQAVPVPGIGNKISVRKARQAAEQEDGIIVEHEIIGIAWHLGKKYGHSYDPLILLLLVRPWFYIILMHLMPHSSDS
jgi:hypothetical protein